MIVKRRGSRFANQLKCAAVGDVWYCRRGHADLRRAPAHGGGDSRTDGVDAEEVIAKL